MWSAVFVCLTVTSSFSGIEFCNHRGFSDIAKAIHQVSIAKLLQHIIINACACVLQMANQTASQMALRPYRLLVHWTCRCEKKRAEPVPMHQHNMFPIYLLLPTGLGVKIT